MKIAFIFNQKKLLGKLTNIFTGCYCYHIGFVDEESDIFYDMDLLRRKRRWNDYKATREHILVETPVHISKEFLEEKLLTDENYYSFLDVFLFILRPLYHLFGKSTRNAGGLICSEMVYNDLVENGWDFKFAEVPSPCAMYHVLG